MLNQCTIIGRLTRANDDKGVVTSFEKNGNTNKIYRNAVACERDFKGQNGEREVDFIEFTAWRNNAEFLEKYAGKGKLVAISGRLQIDSYTPEGSDKAIKTSKIDATSVQLLEWGDKNNTTNTGDGNNQAAAATDDDCPF
jgi:single-strand DNA-binding protein